MLYFMIIIFQIACVVSAMEGRMRNFECTGSSFKKKNSLFFNDFKAFVMQILYLVYLLDCSDNIMKKNVHRRYKTVILWTVSGIGLFLGSRLYKNFFFYRKLLFFLWYPIIFLIMNIKFILIVMIHSTFSSLLFF